jgi:hypothetical protein
MDSPIRTAPSHAWAIRDIGGRMMPSLFSSGEEFALDDRQQGVFNALLTRHADLASMYRAALLIAAAVSEDGDRRMRVAQLCHAMREVMNRFADAIGANSSQRIKPPTSEQLHALPTLLADHPELVLNQDQELIPVPRGVAAAFDKLIKTAIQEKARSRDIAAALLTDDGNTDHPAVRQWMDVRNFFVRWAHLEAEATDLSKLPTDDDILRKVRVVEDLIEGVTKLFFDARRSVDDLLVEINQTEED